MSPLRGTTAMILLTSLSAGGFALAACGDDDSAAAVKAEDVVRGYADGVLASYQASAASAKQLDAAIDAFLAAPSEQALTAAKQAWLSARNDYGVTESFRFYGGPIDDATTGPEGLINSWPMDEAYVDYVEGDPDAGIVNDPADYPTIDADLLVSLNTAGGETNVSTGWHAIEFLLWGQDLSEDGPGARPASDYTTAPNADRRAAYLSTVSDLLVSNLDTLVDAWSDTEGSYRATFLALRTDQALQDIITGAGELSRGELAGERMTVAYESRSQEDEHSCFSDNTTNDLVSNATGVAMVLTGAFPSGQRSPSVIDLVRAEDADLADELAAQLATSITATEAIPAPFDQILRQGVSDDDPARQAVATAITDLETQTDTIVAAAKAIGVTIEVT